jgi:hypothetical protein
LQCWLCGVSHDRESDFKYISLVLAPDLELVSPTGGIENHSELVKRLSLAYGARPNLSIHISHYMPIWTTENTILARYVETRECPRGSDKRVSTALFSKNIDLPNGVSWNYIHETWLDYELKD